MSKIATISIAISTAVMVLAISIVVGFKKEIREKVTGFSAPILITKLSQNSSLEIPPLRKDWVPIGDLQKIPNVQSIHPYTIKAGIVKTNEEIQGVILKGVDSTFSWSFFSSNLVEGRLPNYKSSSASREVLISRINAARLKLKVGDKVKTYFVQHPFRMRSFDIVGIYDSKLQEFDSKFIISDLRHTQKLNQWEDNQYAGFEILIDDFGKLAQTSQAVVDAAGYKIYPDGSRLKIENIKESMSNIFDWLSLQDTNALVVLTLMLFVAAINMITGILILLLDRVRMIGILKALGMSLGSLRYVFIYLSSAIVLKGLLWGNIVGLSLSLLQKYTGLVGLEESTYYLSSVPISIDIAGILLLNVATFLLLALFMLIPLLIINKISPSEIIRYE